jgi:predicted amino acid dehydrogenase
MYCLLRSQWFADQLRADQRPKLMHGDTLTAATVFGQARELVRSRGASAVFLTGATSKIGRAVALRLAADGVTVYLYTESEERFARIQAEAGAARERLHWAPTLLDLSRCDVCVTGKGTGGARLLAQAKPGTVFVNFSVPDPLSSTLLSAGDVEHHDGGLLAYDREATTLSFGMRLAVGQTYACHAWLLVCAANGWTQRDELGPVDVAALDTFWRASEATGLTRTPMTSADNATAA